MILFPAIVFGLSLLFWFLKPELVSSIFIANLWLLSYPHTFATFKRSYFLKKENKIKAGICIILFLLLNIFIVYRFDFVALINIYFYSQFFHYCRQNFGISKLHSKSWLKMDSVLFHFYHVFILLFFWRVPHSFLGFKIFSPTLQQNLTTFSFGAICFIGLYFISRMKKISAMTYIYLALSAVMTYSSESFILGWLGLHLFHNSQYLVMGHRLSPRNSFLWYWFSLIFLVVVLYSLAGYLDQKIGFFISISFCLILAVNFSHYLFDSFLWRRKYRENYP